MPRAKKAPARSAKRAAKRVTACKPVPTTKGSPRPRSKGVLECLSAEEAARVLRQLLDVAPELRPQAEEIATTIITNVDEQGIAAKVEAALTDLDITDIGNRAGRETWGYVEPTEAAWKLLGDVVDPFKEEAIRLASLGHHRAAVSASRGLLLGLYAVRDYNGDGLLRWAEDFPGEAAAQALSEIRAAFGRRPGKAELLTEIIDDMPDWEFLARVMRKG